MDATAAIGLYRFSKWKTLLPERAAVSETTTLLYYTKLGMPFNSF